MLSMNSLPPSLSSSHPCSPHPSPPPPLPLSLTLQLCFVLDTPVYPSATMLSNEPYLWALCTPHLSAIEEPEPWPGFCWHGCALLSFLDSTTGHCLCVLGCDLQTKKLMKMAARPPLQTEHDWPEAQRSTLGNWEVWLTLFNHPNDQLQTEAHYNKTLLQTLHSTISNQPNTYQPGGEVSIRNAKFQGSG